MALKQNKKMQRHLRELAELAYERELSAPSQALLQEFLRWEKKEMDVFELNAKIHEFHQGISRSLYAQYSGADAAIGVASALHRGIVKRDEM